MNYTVVINGFVWVGCMGYYFLIARRWYTGPQTTIDEGASALSSDTISNTIWPGPHAGRPSEAVADKND